MNYPKTNFMVINKHSHKSVSASFNLNLNDIALKRVETIKYLGISIDETLTWTSHITQLTLQLSRYPSLFYRLGSYVVCYITSWFRARYNRELLFGQFKFNLFVLCFKTKNTPIYVKKESSKAQEGSEMTIQSSTQLPPSK